MIKTIVWHRLEPVTRTASLDRALEARLHDPLWLIGRQWQFGELMGDDAGSPIGVAVTSTTALLSRWRPGDGGAPADYDPARAPLEVLVEREPDQPSPLRLRAEAGAQLALLARESGALDAAIAALVAAFPLPGSTPDELVTDVTAGRLLSIFRGRVADGVAAAAVLRTALAGLGGANPPTIAVTGPSGMAEVPTPAARAFVDWFEREVDRPGAGRCWVGERLEYRFAVAARTGSRDVALVGPEYRGGTLDWHDVQHDPAVDLAIDPASAAPQPAVLHVLPTPVSFPGMPNDRFWEFEDRTVSFASVEAAPEDLGRLAVVEFATVFGNDWFVVPMPVPYGSLVQVGPLVVTDTFGEAFLIRSSAASAAGGAPWRMFQLTDADSARGAGGSMDLLFVPPVLTTALEGPAIEEVLFLRDEMANLAWGVERRVQGADARPRDRADEYHGTPSASTPPVTSVADLVYRLQTEVPAHWIPFVPVHDDDTNRGVRLHRAAMLRYGGGAPRPVMPLGRLLEPDQPDLVLFEEEVPREGTRVARVPAVCRWRDGRTHFWIGRRVTVGRGEGASGLRFDLAAPPG